MYVLAGLHIGRFWRRRPVRWMAAILKDHREPVLARIQCLLVPAHHLLLLRLVVVMKVHDRVTVVGLFDQLGNVGEPTEIVLAEGRPAFVGCKTGRE